MADEDVKIVLSLDDNTEGPANKAAQGGAKIKESYEQAGEAADKFSIQAALANERVANSYMSLAKSMAGAKNSWFDPKAPESENFGSAQDVVFYEKLGAAQKQSLALVQQLDAAEESLSRSRRRDQDKADVEAWNAAFKGQIDSVKALEQAEQKSATATQKMVSEEQKLEAARRRSQDRTNVDEWNDSMRDQEQVVRATARAEEQRLQSLSSTRYALYDISSAYLTVGLAGTAALVATVGANAHFETAFTGVERTSGLAGEQLHQLRNELIGLSTEIPESFSSLSDIATLGGQLGIAGDEIDGFTESVAKFSATTNATTEAAATGFGRIAQLTDAGKDSFDSIAASIYTVGVNSVATETQILNVAQEIATAGNLAGFSTAEIIGLSGALASLGVQPERARGNIQRIFQEIGDASREGGEQLDTFAKLAGMSADEFREAWSSDAADTFVRVTDGMAAAKDAGADLDVILDSMGISAVRDIQTFKQLADNTDLLHQTMRDANEAYADGTSLNAAYADVADNLASKLQTLGNSIMAIFAELGNAPFLGEFVDGLKLITNAIGGVLRWLNGLGEGSAVFGTITTMVMAGVTAFALYNAGMLALRGTYYAMLTAQINLQRSGAALDFSFKNLLNAVRGFTGGVTANTTALNANAAAAERTALSVGKVGTASKLASGATSMLGAGLRALVSPVGLITVGMTAISFLPKLFGDTSEEVAKLSLSWEGLDAALKQDTEHWRATGEAQELFITKADGSVERMGMLGQAITNVGFSQDSTKVKTNALTQAFMDQTTAVGAATNKYIAEQLLQNQEFLTMFQENSSALSAAGVSAEEFGQKLMNLGATGTVEWLNSLGTELRHTRDEMALANPGVYTEELMVLDAQLEALSTLVTTVSPTFGELSTQVDIAAGVQKAFNDQLGDTEDGLGGVGDSADYAEQNLINMANGLLGAQGAAADFEGAMYNLGTAMANNGNDFSVYTENGRANLDALQRAVAAAATSAAGNEAAFAQSLRSILASLAGHNVDVMNLFPKLVVQAKIKSTNDLTTSMRSLSFATGYASQAKKSYSSAANKAAKSSNKAAKAAKEAAKEVKTLSDYVSDLSGVMSKSFEFRWGLDQSIDDTADAFDKLVKMQEDAQKEIENSRTKISDLRQSLRDLQADMNILHADRATLQYQLKVSTDYGDTLRANEIMAELSKNQEEISKNNTEQQTTSKNLSSAQKDLSNAQANAVANLSGNTAASREQRDAVLALVKAYQEQVQALANSGLNQKQLQVETEKLRQNFVSQMQQLGYNQTEIKKYSATFTDLSKVIAAVPRNITISVDPNPAQRAINEFRAKNTGGRGLSAPINTPSSVGTPSYNPSALRGVGNQMGVELARAMAAKMVIHTVAGGVRKALQFFSGFQSGGYTGNIPTNKIAGVVHGREWVANAQQTNPATGLPYPAVLASLMAAQGVSPVATAPSAPAMPSVIQVELSPTDRNLLSKAGFNGTITIGDKVIASAANKANSNSTTRGS